MVHIAVIGAGTAGLCSAKTALQSGCDVTVFEQAKQVGGTWVYTLFVYFILRLISIIITIASLLDYY